MIVGTGRALLFLHWPVSAETLRPLVPPELTIDEFDGAAYVSLVPHAVESARIGGFPRGLGHSFLETRVRTYVTLDRRDPGIFLLGSYVSSRIALAMARYAVGLPYYLAPMHLRREQGRLEYQVQDRSSSGPSLAVSYEPGDSLGPAEAGTLDHFLVERYAQHVVRGTEVWTARVRHPPYPRQRVTIRAMRENLLAAAGLPPAGDRPPLCGYSERIDMEFLPPRRAADT